MPSSKKAEWLENTERQRIVCVFHRGGLPKPIKPIDVLSRVLVKMFNKTMEITSEPENVP